MSAREAYIAGRSGGSRPPKQTSPSSTQGNRQQEREQQAYDAGRQEKERAQTIQQQGITGLSQDQREQARSIAEQTGKDPYDTKSQIAPGGGIIASKQAPIDKFNEFMTTVVDTGNIRFPSFNPIFGAIQGFQNTNQVLEKLSKGSELNSNDKITVFNLYNNLPLDDLQNLVEKYAKDNKIDSNDIFENINDTLSNLENLVEDQEDNLQSYFDRMDKMGLGDTIKTMAGDLTGTRDTKGITTLEDITDDLGSEGLAYLKATDPKTYYRLRPNDRDLANVSLQGLSNSPEDRQFAARIMEARAEAMNRQSRQDANMGQGIMASSPAFATPASQYGMFIGKPGPFIGNFVDTDGDGVDDRFQTGPGQPRQPFVNPKAPLPGASGTAQPVGTGITPFNINQFYASLPQYTQQGIMAPTNLSRFTDALRMFPGMA